MRVRRLTLGPLDANCWLVDDGEGGPVVVIDPADEPEAILEALGDDQLAAVVLTHGHFDHIGGLRGLLAVRRAPLLVHEADARSMTTAEGAGGVPFGLPYSAPPADRLVSEGDVIEAGAISLTVLHTPGHTPGSICLYSEGHLFSGDTLFSGSIGRTDFPGGDITAMRRSVNRLAALSGETRAYPGHGPETTIAREHRLNPFFPRA